MMSRPQFVILLGFAFTAVWIAGDFSDAVLCMIGAAVFYAADAYLRGELDLEEVNQRLSQPRGRR